jgi:NAD(P)-dependent dehydrogenase (short-subunit alcohol dehydrogenase family)
VRRWFITGVSSGLGRALAIAALESGDIVAGTVRTEAALAEFTMLESHRAFGFRLDVTDHAAVTAAVNAAEIALGGIDIVVNNAGYSAEGTLEEFDWAEIRAQFETNVFGPVAVMKAALPLMRARRAGLIVNVSSLAGQATGAGIGIYGGGKLALEAISEALAQEVESLGIDVMIVIPGAFRTDLGANRRSTADSIPEYAEQNRTRRARLAALSGHQRGDPRKAADVILAAVNARPRPRRLALGPDAVDVIRGRLGQLSAEIEPWEGFSRGTDLIT